MSRGSRTDYDPIAQAGFGFPYLLILHSAAGNLTKYVGGQDFAWIPPSFGAEQHGFVASLTDYQIVYGTPGVGGSGTDTFRLQLVDQTANVVGAGTVSSTTTAVTGSGTAFLTFFSVGQYITDGVTTLKITAIADNTHLTVEAAPAVAFSGSTYYRVPTISTIATIAVPANTPNVPPVDLRTGNKGIKILAGQGIRLDTGVIGTGYSPAPAAVRIRLGVELYSITA